MPAQATPVVSRVPLIGTSATVQETSPGSGVWDITLHTTVTNQPTTFTIRGASTTSSAG